MPKQYVLKYLIDDAKAQAVVKRSIRGFQDIEKAALAAAKASEGAVARTAQADAAATDAIVRNAKRADRETVDSRKKKTVDLEAIELKWAVRDYKIRVKAEKDKERLDDFARARHEKQIRGLEGIEQQYLVRDYQRRVQAEKRKASLEEGAYGRLAKFKRRALTDEEVTAVAANKAIDASNKRRIDAHMKGLGEEKDAFALGIAQAFGLSGMATKAGLALGTIGAAAAGIRATAGALAQARDNATGLAQGALGFQAALRPLASVAGRRADESFGAEIQKYGAETGLGAEGSARFLESFLGRAQIVKGRNLSDAEFGRYSRAAGTFAAAKGLPEDVAGELFGGVLKTENFQAKGQGAGAALARAAGAVKILDAGSGKLPVLAPQLNQLMATLASESELEGVFRNAGQAAVATSVAAEANPEEAATMVQRTAEALRDFEDKDKAAFFKRSGITDKDTFLEAIGKANRTIGEEVSKGVPVDTALKRFGFDKERIGKRGLKTFYNARDTVLAPQLKNLAASETPGAEMAARQELFRSTATPEFEYARGRARVEEAKYQKGREGIPLEIAKAKAEERFVREGGDTTTMGVVKQYLTSFFASLGTRSGREIEIENMAVGTERARAGQGGMSYFGNIFGDPAGEVRKLREALEANTKAMQTQSGGPPRPAARPAPPMLGQPVGAQPGR